jgi:hypothetical protein
MVDLPARHAGGAGAASPATKARKSGTQATHFSFPLTIRSRYLLIFTPIVTSTFCLRCRFRCGHRRIDELKITRATSTCSCARCCHGTNCNSAISEKNIEGKVERPGEEWVTWRSDWPYMVAWVAAVGLESPAASLLCLFPMNRARAGCYGPAR